MSLLVIVRAVHIGATLWLFGEFVFFTAVLKPALRVIALDASVVARRRDPALRLRRTSAACIFVAVTSALAWLWLESASMSGTPLAGALNVELLATVLRDTHFGRTWLWRLAIALLLMVLLAVVRTRGARHDAVLRWGGSFLAGVYAATLAGIGHAYADVGADGYIHLASDAIHVLAAGAWVGALPGFLFLLARREGMAGDDRYALAALAAQRFSGVSIAAVTTLAVTGLVNAAYLIGSAAALMGTDYGRLLCLKLGAFALMLGPAALNRLYATPRLAAAVAAARGARDEGARSSACVRLRRNVMLEIAAGALIVVIVAALGITVPATHFSRQPSALPMERHGH